MRKKDTARGAVRETGPAMVYMGPPVKDVMQGGTAFVGGYPPKVGELLRAHPFMAGLMVPADRLAETRKAMEDPDGELAMLYRRAEKGAV